VNIASEDKNIEATIFVNNTGGLVVNYTKLMLMIDGELKEFPQTQVYLFDAKDSIINKCKIV
jgi:hypothetical protein